MAVRDNSRLGQLAAARAHRTTSARPRGLHPWQFAPMAARFARAHRTTSARARGLHPRQFAARGRAGQVAPMAARFARAHRTTSARPRGLHPWQFAPVAARFARAHRTTSARPRGLHPWQFAVRGRAGRAAFLRSARAGPSAKARWRNVKVFSQVFFKKLVGFGVKPQDLTGVRGVLVPGGHRSGPTEAAAETSHRLPIHKKGGDARPQQGGTL